MKSNKTSISIIFIIIIGLLTACGDMESIHEEYLQGEKIYAGKLDSLTVFSGYKRVKIVGLTHYLGQSKDCYIEWDDQVQNFQIPESPGETFEMIVEGLEERNYEFRVYTQDEALNRSVLQTCKGKAIGDIFVNSQNSRRFTSSNANDTLTFEWANKAETEYLAKTILSYEHEAGQMIDILVWPDDEKTSITDWKSGGDLEIQSAIVTGDLGFDTIFLDPANYKLP